MILGVTIILASAALVLAGVVMHARTVRRTRIVTEAKAEIDELYKQANRQMRKALTDWLDQR